jgi:hypothetical protein
MVAARCRFGPEVARRHVFYLDRFEQQPSLPHHRARTLTLATFSKQLAQGRGRSGCTGEPLPTLEYSERLSQHPLCRGVAPATRHFPGSRDPGARTRHAFVVRNLHRNSRRHEERSLQEHRRF